MINWKIDNQEASWIGEIVDRAERLGLVADRMTSVMDITATHLNGCSLKLVDMLQGADLDFAHDFAGIARHVDRDTGQLTDCFVPRFAS